MSVRHSQRDIGDLVVKTLVWNIWLTRNECIFNAKILHVHDVILSIDRMILLWCSSATDRSHGKLEDSLKCIRRSLEFLGPRAEEHTVSSAWGRHKI